MRALLDTRNGDHVCRFSHFRLANKLDGSIATACLSDLLSVSLEFLCDRTSLESLHGSIDSY